MFYVVRFLLLWLQFVGVYLFVAFAFWVDFCFDVVDDMCVGFVIVVVCWFGLVWIGDGCL